MATRYDEMRLVRCPGCEGPLGSENWDDLNEDEPEEHYDCDCGVGFVVRRTEGMEVEVERVDYTE